jgi:hypothetical protein
MRTASRIGDKIISASKIEKGRIILIFASKNLIAKEMPEPLVICA